MTYLATKIGNEFLVNTYTANSQTSSSVAPLSSGFIVTWCSDGQNGNGWEVYGQLYNSTGGKSGTEFQVNTHTTSDQKFPSVTSFSDDGFIVTWASDDQDGSGYGIYGQQYDSTGAKSGSEFQINTYTTNEQKFPVIASFNNDGFIVIWHSVDQDGDAGGIYGQRYDSVGEKSGSEFLVNTFTSGIQFLPAVASFSDNGFVVTWSSNGQDGDGWGVYAQRYDSVGAKSGSEFRVNTYTTNDQKRSSIASFSDNGFVVTWHSYGQDGDGWGVYAQRYDSVGAKSGSEFRVNTYTTSDQMYPSVATFSDNRFVITWSSYNQDGSGYEVYCQLYNNVGEQSGSEFRVNTYITGDQKLSSIAISFSEDKFLVMWDSYGQDGDSDGVYGQLYILNNTPEVTSFSKTSLEDVNITFAVADFTDHFSDVNNDSLTKIQIVSLPSNGILKLSSIPVVEDQEINIAGLVNLTFEPNENWNGNTAFAWKGHDGTVYSENSAIVDITINAVNDAPTVTTVSKTGTEDTVLTFATADFTSHFDDVDGDSLTKVQIVSLPSNGVLKLSGIPVVENQEVNAANLISLTFAPNSNWRGETSFSWKASDGSLYSNMADVYLSITELPACKCDWAAVVGRINEVLND